MPKLTWETVRAIRALGPDRSFTYAEIGARFGIPGSRVASLMTGQTWKDRNYVPCLRPRNKIDWPEVREIRRRYADGETGAALSKVFGISAVAVHFIVTGANWRNDPLGLVYTPVKRERGVTPTLAPWREPVMEVTA